MRRRNELLGITDGVLETYLHNALARDGVGGDIEDEPAQNSGMYS